MFGEIKVTRWTLLFAIVLIIASSDATNLSRSQVVGPREPAPILTGLWTLDTGETISISQDASGSVTAEFKPHVRCLTDSTRKVLFTAPLKRTSSGEFSLESDMFWACTRTPAMVTECGVKELFQTKFKATVSLSGITGEVLRPYYDFELVNGRRTNCTRNENGDEWEPFSLTPVCKPPNLGSVPPPWFDRSKPCRSVQRGSISWAQTRRSNHDLSYTVNVCGQVIRFIQEGMGAAEQQPPGVKTFQVCCEKWQSSAATTPPCDRLKDIDCDGTVNEGDSDPVSASYDAWSVKDFVINQPIAMAVPFWDQIQAPSQSNCPECQWELERLDFDCENVITRAGRREFTTAKYSYKGTWKCPMTGKLEEYSRGAILPNARCPIPPGTRHWP